MGNKESTEESAPEDEQEEAKRKPEEQPEPKESSTPGTINWEELTYQDIYLEESHESGEGLTDFTEDDSDKFDSEGGKFLPDSFSMISRVRPFAAWLSVNICYDKAKSLLKVRIKGTTDVPGRGQGGADSYQVMLKLIPLGRHAVYSKIRIGPNPTFEDRWEFQLSPADFVNASLQFRLCGCVHGERENVLGQGSIELSQINPRIDNPLTVQLVPPAEPSIISQHESDEEQTDPENEARIQGFIGEFSHSMNKVAQTPLPQPLDSELLLNAAYNPVTGRFECIVQQAHGIHVPGTKSSKPYSYVLLQLQDEDKTILSQGKTKICKKLNNPAFNETFFFSITASRIETVTLVVLMYHKKKPGRKIYLGGLSMGLLNTTKIEKEHWDEIIRSSGQRVARWHKLYSNVQ